MTVPNEPIPNLPLLRKILDHIDAHPEEWDQSTWGIQNACGTAYCVAGHAVVMTGGQMRWNAAGTSLGMANGGDVEAVAADELGLTFEESWDLFKCENTRTDVQQIAEAIAARAGEVL